MAGLVRALQRLQRSTATFAVISITLVGIGASAATNWGVDLAGASNGVARSAAVANLSVSAVDPPAASHPLYPGGTGDIVLTIANPNPFPVTITAVQLPASTTYASGYTTNTLTTTKPGCLATTPSFVSWDDATPTSGSKHTLLTPLTVGASGTPNDPLTVTLADDASMGMQAPMACAGAYFALPPFTNLTATVGSATPTLTPTTDGWTS